MPRRPSSVTAAPLFALAFALSSCAFEGADGGSGGTGSEPAPAVKELFEPLAPPTPDRLAGVWSTTSTNANGQAELRFRFADKRIVGGVKCTFSSRGNKVMTVGQVGQITFGDVDAKQGELRLGRELEFSETSGDLRCEGKMANVSWVFVITGTSMVLSAVELGGTIGLTKVGD
jgi:hypothetical protein